MRIVPDKPIPLKTSKWSDEFFYLSTSNNILYHFIIKFIPKQSKRKRYPHWFKVDTIRVIKENLK